MPTITVTTRDGQDHSVNAPNGYTIMESIREAGLDELLALCGGCCSCATCHVYIEPGSEGRVTPMNEDEDGLLDSSSHRTATSRLSCQIRVDDSLEGLRLTIAPED